MAAVAEKAEVALKGLLTPVVGGAVGGWINWGLTQFAMGTIGPVVEDGVLQNTGMGLLQVAPAVLEVVLLLVVADMVVAAVLVECKLPAAGKSLLGGVGAVEFISPRGKGVGWLGGEYILLKKKTGNITKSQNDLNKFEFKVYKNLFRDTSQ